MGKVKLRRLAGSTKAAMDAGEDWAGIAAAEQVESVILSQASEPTRNLLRPCLCPLSRMVEMLCPATMAITSAGLVTGYGPVGISPDHLLVIVASPHDAISLVSNGWPDWIRPEIEQLDPVSCWGVLARIAEGGMGELRGREGLVAEIITYRLNSRLELVNEVAAEIRSQGLTPALAIIAAATEDHKMAGGSAVIKLPQSVQLPETA